LTSGDVILSNPYIKIRSVNETNVTNGKKYTFYYEALSGVD
jgi:hypothetical protein